jgi:hypothetical protein
MNLISNVRVADQKSLRVRRRRTARDLGAEIGGGKQRNSFFDTLLSAPVSSLSTRSFAGSRPQAGLLPHTQRPSQLTHSDPYTFELFLRARIAGSAAVLPVGLLTYIFVC